MSSDATRIEEHLRAASDAILLLLTEIGQLERHKRGIPPGEPRFDEVSRSIRAAAQGLAAFTEGEEAWARTATDGRTEIEPIAQSEAAPDTAAILERSAMMTPDPARRVERTLATAEAKLAAGAFNSALGLLAMARAGPGTCRPVPVRPAAGRPNVRSSRGRLPLHHR